MVPIEINSFKIPWPHDQLWLKLAKELDTQFKTPTWAFEMFRGCISELHWCWCVDTHTSSGLTIQVSAPAPALAIQPKLCVYHTSTHNMGLYIPSIYSLIALYSQIQAPAINNYFKLEENWTFWIQIFVKCKKVFIWSWIQPGWIVDIC